MIKRKSYRKYDPAIKAAIAMTGRLDLFPQLDIPRMTAQHWIRVGAFVLSDPTLESMVSALNDTVGDVESLRRSIGEKNSVIDLVRSTYKTMGFELSWRHVDSPEKRRAILGLLESAMKYAPRSVCLAAIGLSISRYKRWRRERRGCGIAGVKSCPKGNANQLTAKEVNVMRGLVTSIEYAHFPIRSLHYYAKREGVLVCSYSTWRKYIDDFEWKRPRKQFRERKRKIGIRARHPNEIWHLDVSYFILSDRTKLYIQAIIDNYSRFVVAWQVLSSYDGSKTGELLQKALSETRRQPPKGRSLRLIVDGGGENRSSSVGRLESQGHFRKRVARFEISFSNSMVETLFRSMKHNYLFHKEIRSLSALKRHVHFWIKEHNEKIPHTAFNGETPSARYTKTWTKEQEIRILVRQQEAVKLRIKENQKLYCEMCNVA